MEAELRQLFYDKILGFAADELLTVAFPNVPFTPPKDTGNLDNDFGNHYLSVYAMPVKPSVVEVCGGSKYEWMLQVSIVARDGIGEIRPLHFADKLRDEVFPIYSELEGETHTFQVRSKPHVAKPMMEDGWQNYPVSFLVHTFN